MGDVCRRCWTLCAGYVNRDNGRVRRAEALIRKGVKAAGVKLPKNRVTNATSYVRAFMSEYIFRHSQSSPSCKILYVDFCGCEKLHERYLQERTGFKTLKFSSFVKLWNEVLCSGVSDPETAEQYEVQIRKSHAKGFKKCNRCCYLKERIRGTSDLAKRESYKRKLQQHIDEITDDRDALTRIQRLCITNLEHCGFYIDVADSAKFQIPTT